MTQELFTPRDQELLSHYVRFQGNYRSITTFGEGPEGAPKPLFVLEFAPPSEEYDWLYMTLGASRQPMPRQAPTHRIELLIYARQRQPELANVLAKLALYPFVNDTFLDVGHTIAGTPDTGIIPGSPLTEFLLTYPYFEAEGFDRISHADGSHTQILWATPLYLSERVYVTQHGWRALVEQVFPQHEVQPADLWRAPVV
jgi:hypothetical protein